jgi:Fe-S-cluster containining protein
MISEEEFQDPDTNYDELEADRMVADSEPTLPCLEGKVGERAVDKCKAACCGLVPIPYSIYEKHIDELPDGTKIYPFTAQGYVFALVTEDVGDGKVDVHCAFLKDCKCTIYADRPPLCKMYGNEADIMMCCPLFTKHGDKRSRQDRRRIERKATKEYMRILRDLQYRERMVLQYGKGE